MVERQILPWHTKSIFIISFISFPLFFAVFQRIRAARRVLHKPSSLDAILHNTNSCGISRKRFIRKCVNYILFHFVPVSLTFNLSLALLYCNLSFFEIDELQLRSSPDNFCRNIFSGSQTAGFSSSRPQSRRSISRGFSLSVSS